MDFQLPTFIKTTEDKNECNIYLDLLEKSLFQNNSQEILHDKIPSFFSDVITKDLAQTKLTLSDYLTKIKTIIGSLEPVSLTLAIRPSVAFQNTLYNWITSHLSPKAILDLSYDPSLIAGVIITYQGKYHDLSYKNTLTQYFNSKPN